ncbi:hypothetical protein HGB07_04630 [Candidatus Roizmanbacteria bacterium]|nr:hypothetical protein [Candidatus Roizmanbacteria bacterium]
MILSDFYTLSVAHSARCTHMKMAITIPIFNTRELPLVSSFLEEKLPTIFSSLCFNEDNLPFSEEVKATEVGHLFEHILLEHLCQNQLLNGCDCAVFSGRTYWNWKKEQEGIFHIVVDAGKEHSSIFEDALEKTIHLTNDIFRLPLHVPTNPWLSQSRF